jgi:hypothetical protein
MLQLAADEMGVVSEQPLCFWSQARQEHGLQAGSIDALDSALGEKSAEPACKAVADNLVVGHCGDALSGSRGLPGLKMTSDSETRVVM